MATVHTRAEIYAVCEDLLRDNVPLSRRRVQVKLRERCASLGVPEAGATNALVDGVITEMMSSRRASAGSAALSADPALGSVEIPVELTEALSRSAEVVRRVYREGVVLAERRAESAGRVLLDAAEAERRALESRLQDELTHSGTERTSLAEELDAAVDALEASETRARQIGLLLTAERECLVDLQRQSRAQIAQLEEDVRAAHATKSKAEADKKAIEIEFSRLIGAHETLVVTCARAESQLAVLHATVAARNAALQQIATGSEHERMREELDGTESPR